MTAFRRAGMPAGSLNPIDLLDYTRFVAAEVAAGRYPYVEYDAETRWHQRLYRDTRVDVWLISWLPTQGTQLHDHGGSSGAFTVLSGTLSEAVYRRAHPLRPDAGGTRGESLLPPGEVSTPSLVEHQRLAATGVGFGARYVHDVRNLSDLPAVSVHAYSPPLTSMNFYDLGERGELLRLATVATDEPEPDVVAPGAGTVPGSAA